VRFVNVITTTTAPSKLGTPPLIDGEFEVSFMNFCSQSCLQNTACRGCRLELTCRSHVPGALKKNHACTSEAAHARSSTLPWHPVPVPYLAPVPYVAGTCTLPVPVLIVHIMGRRVFLLFAWWLFLVKQYIAEERAVRGHVQFELVFLVISQNFAEN
jgi:hypothetical protein